MAYANGQIPTSQLTYVGDSPTLGRQYLYAPAAAKLAPLRAAFKKRFGKDLSLTECYRSYDRQVYLYNGWSKRLPGFNLAAKPGTSKHGNGVAVDFGSGVNNLGSVEHTWMVANAPTYGYKWTGGGFSPREAWHFEYVGGGSAATVNSNAGLKVVQQQLNFLGYNVGTEDGQDGLKTQTGVRSFQAAYGLTQDGVPGPKTKAKLIEIIKDIQNRLTAKGFNTKGADGIPGANTKSAAKAFQASKGLIADSIIGPSSLKVLKTADKPKVSDVVKQWQRDLHFIGYVITVDGLDGNSSKATLKEFQKDQKITQDGEYGPTTEAKLRAEVKKVQQQLKTRGYDPKGVDGITGDGSEKALDKFQADNKLAIDHCAGPGTRAKLFAVVTAPKPVTPKPSTPVVTIPKPPVVTAPSSDIPTGFKKAVDIAWPQTGVFDWAALAKDNLGVIIKAAGAEDPAPKQVYGPALLYTQHLAGARSVKMPVGHYFFNNGSVDIKSQADKFIEVLKANIQVGDIIALDVEPDGADCPQFTPAQALEFCNYIEAVFNTKVFIYINRSTMTNNDWSKVVKAGHPLWLATLEGKPYTDAVKYWSEFTINQYDSKTSTPGYTAGAIDRNIIKADAFSKFGFKGYPVKPSDNTSFITELNNKIVALEKDVAAIKELAGKFK